MPNLFLINRSSQDFSVPVIQEGKRRDVLVPGKGGTVLLMDAKPTAELEAIHRSKNLDLVYQVRD